MSYRYGETTAYTAARNCSNGRDSHQYGYGIVDPVAALTKDVPEVDTNPLIKPSKNATKPQTGDQAADSGGIGPGGYGLIALGVIAAIVLAIAALVVLNRRRHPVPAATLPTTGAAAPLPPTTSTTGIRTPTPPPPPPPPRS
ncbi:MAG: hypothetical protein ACRDTU_23055 [Micromonosporaceae bacterium]